MDPWESVRLAFQALNANRLRTFLTLLGVIIGVGAVITLLAVGRGQQEATLQQIERLGSNLLYVRPGSTTVQGVRTEAGSAATLTLDDAQAIAQEVPFVAAVASEIESMAQMSVAGGQNINARIVGTTPDYPAVRSFQVAEGEFFSDADVDGRTSVAVLGSSVASELFPDSDPLGQSVRLSVRDMSLNVRVIGVMEKKGGTGMGSLDEQIFMPLTTVQSRISFQRTAFGQSVSTINVKVTEKKRMDDVVQAIGSLLRERHQVLEDDFTIQSQEDIAAAATEVSESETLLLASIAGISLLVGGIGIMNTMIVSVVERTREIGIRKAVGARRGDILQQFLVESLVVSVGGGLLGIALGIGLSKAAEGQTIFNRLIHTSVTLEAVLLAFVVSAATGIVFGIYPAMRAARLNPIEALHYE